MLIDKQKIFIIPSCDKNKSLVTLTDNDRLNFCNVCRLFYQRDEAFFKHEELTGESETTIV